MSQKSAVHHLALVTAPTPSPAICSSFGISSHCWMCQNLVCSSCADVPQPSQVLVLVWGCVRDVQRAVLAGSSLLGAEPCLEWWLQSALSREAWICFVLFKGVQVNVIILVISEWWPVEQVYSRQWDSSRTNFLHGRKDVLLGEAAETHFAPVLCCGPSCKLPKLSSSSSALLSGLWSSHSPFSIGSCWLQRENTQPPHYP